MQSDNCLFCINVNCVSENSKVITFLSLSASTLVKSFNETFIKIISLKSVGFFAVLDFGIKAINEEFIHEESFLDSKNSEKKLK